MPVLIALLLVLVTGFQLFFRYEQLPNREDNGVVYERDRLTGVTREIHPGDKVDFVDRLMGGKKDAIKTERVTAMLQDATFKKDDEAFQLNMTSSRKKETTEKLVGVDPLEATEPPVPQATPQSHSPEQVVSRSFDLDDDGSPEQIIQSVTANDGYLDISVIKNGRELFYARGKQLQILPSKKHGWSDLALITQSSKLRNVYRFDKKQDGYVLKGHMPDSDQG